MASHVDEERDYDVNLCKKIYKNRYELLKENIEIIYFIYELMSNGQLDPYL